MLLPLRLLHAGESRRPDAQPSRLSLGFMVCPWLARAGLSVDMSHACPRETWTPAQEVFSEVSCWKPVKTHKSQLDALGILVLNLLRLSSQNVAFGTPRI